MYNNAIKRIILEYEDGETYQLRYTAAELALLHLFQKSYAWEFYKTLSDCLGIEDSHSIDINKKEKLEKWLISGNLERAKEDGYIIQFDNYGKAFVKSQNIPHNSTDYFFKEFSIIP